MHVLVMAADGVLFDTLPLRTDAVVAGAAAVGIALDAQAVRAALPGRTLEEAVDTLLAEHEAIALDPTRATIATLEAQRRYTRAVQQGVTVHPAARQRLIEAAKQGHRVILRADSARRDIAPLLQLAGLEEQVTALRAADDHPTGPMSAEASWQAIAHRLHSWSISRLTVSIDELPEVTARVAIPWDQTH